MEHWIQQKMIRKKEGSKYSVGSLMSDCVKAFQKCKISIRKFGLNLLGVFFYKSTINVIFGTALKPVTVI